MPEMFRFCGQRLRVSKRAHKTCDPVNGLEARRMPNAVHLEGTRCDGAAHDGCQAGCLFYWKEVWLKRIDRKAVDAPVNGSNSGSNGCTEQDVQAGTRVFAEPISSGDITYICQATQVSRATQPLRWWDLSQYVEDITSGNARLLQLFGAFVFFVYHNLAGAGLGLGAAMRWAYDVFQKVRGAPPYPWRMGKVQKACGRQALSSMPRWATR